MKIVLYGTHCPNCKMVERKLVSKNLEYEMVDDPEKVVAFGEQHNKKSMPLLDVDGEVMDLKAIIEWLRER